MSAFKLKHNRAKAAVQITTLDDIHKKIVVSFQNRKTLLPEKEHQLQKISQQLIELESYGHYSVDEIKKRAEFKAEIKKLQDEINDIKNDLSELDYYSKTDDIIMDYYEIADNDDHILYDLHPELSNEKVGENNNIHIDKLDLLNQKNTNKQYIKKTIKRRKRNINDEPQHTILDFLTGTANITSEENTDITETHEKPTQQEKNEKNEKNEKDEQEEKSKNKAELFEQYMMIVDNEYKCERKKNNNIIRKCEICKIDKTLITSEGIFVCQQCGEVEPIIIDSEKPNYKEAVSDTKPGYPYKRKMAFENRIILLVTLVAI